MRRVLFTLAAVISLAACAGKEGAAGPMGPTGPQGPVGPIGPGTTKIILTAPATYSASSGYYGAVAVLPAAAGTNPTQPPAVDCYMASAPSSGVWLAVGGGTTGTYVTFCGVVYGNGAWSAVMSRMPSGWTAAFVVAY